MACDHPRPGRVLYLDDPYCWFPNPDVRKYVDNYAYDVRIDPCPTCAEEAAADPAHTVREEG